MVLKLLTALFGLVFLLACESQQKSCSDCEDAAPTGQELYNNQCSACHGLDGTLGNSGAKDLSKSKITETQIKHILNEGKGAMPAQIQLIGKPSEMDSVVEFIKQLRK
jgi:mono/diheme cytochrome c family protein